MDVRRSNKHWNGSHEIVGLWRDGRTIALLYVLYRDVDPECCPTGGGAVVRYRLEKGHIRRLDPLPPSAFRQGVRLGR
jgi:LppP/LprE lipoprotein